MSGEGRNAWTGYQVCIPSHEYCTILGYFGEDEVPTVLCLSGDSSLFRAVSCRAHARLPHARNENGHSTKQKA